MSILVTFICLPHLGTIQETKINRKGQYTMRKQNNCFKAIVLHSGTHTTRSKHVKNHVK